MSEAASLRCPSCGAPADPKSSSCAHCRVPLTPTRCPWCFAWTYAEASDCLRCGSRAEPPSQGTLSCPTCRELLHPRSKEGARLACCVGCGGIWADAVSFQRICEARESSSVYLGAAQALPAPLTQNPASSPVVYRPCPVCGEFMNRFNFAGISGVILDACKSHGVWFDADELRTVVEFIRAGGLDRVRERERERLAEERRALERARRGEEGQFTVEQREVRDSIIAASSLRIIFRL